MQLSMQFRPTNPRRKRTPDEGLGSANSQPEVDLSPICQWQTRKSAVRAPARDPESLLLVVFVEV